MNIIFVCTGNTCRSPMAEYYLKSKNVDGISVVSRGFSGGEPANPNSVTVMAEKNIDIGAHISKCITTAEAENADRIICMTNSHKQLLSKIGVNDKKITVLGGGIPDPFGCDVDTYRICRDNIFAAVDQLLKDNFFSVTQVRKSTFNDVDAIVNIEKVCFSEPWSKNAITDSMAAGTCFYSAVLNGEVVGYMGLSRIAGEGYVTNVAVLPQFRNMGIGSQLLEYAIKDSEKLLEFMSLEVRDSNKVAYSLYQKLGFLPVGRRKNFYVNPKEDAIIMTKNFV